MIRLCTRCWARKGRKTKATYIEYGHKLCDDCCSDAAEAAHERFLEDYYGGSGPVTIQEQYDAAVKARRELRRLD